MEGWIGPVSKHVDVKQPLSAKLTFAESLESAVPLASGSLRFVCLFGTYLSYSTCSSNEKWLVL